MFTRPTPAEQPAHTGSRGLRTAALASGAAFALGLSFLSAPAFAAATHTIAEVQGTGADTPLDGQTVTVQGVVTADYRGVSNYRGIVIQTQGSGGTEDATPGASDGIFVYLNQADPSVAIGDLVEVTGIAGEHFDQTQLTATDAADTVLVEAGVGAPEPTALPDTLVGDAREPLESMLVEPTGTYLVSSSHQLYNFGTLWLSPGELAVKSTETTDAGPAADAIAAANRAARLLLDDGYSIQVTNSAHPGTQPYFTKDTVVRNGDTVQWPANPYVLSWGFDDWRLQPTVPINDASPAEYKPTFAPSNPRPTAPPTVGGDFSVAAFNVFNYFTTFSDDNPDARGADDQAQFDIQKSKIVAAINALDADVVSLMEIENSIQYGDPVDTALADLVAGLNAAAGSDVWSYVPTPAALADAVATTDAITNAIIYKNASATPVGASFADTDETVWDIAREPIAQTFEVDGRTITVVANHFKSKSPPDVDPTPAEPADGQGFFNAERVEQANSLLAFVDGIAADAAKGPDIMLLGDFNSYAQEDPVQAITAAGFVDLLPSKTDDQYTYTFDGELGSLDHAFASESLAASVTGVGAWSINSPEWSDRGYAFGAAEAGTPFRSSDHDPILVGLSAVAPPVDIDILSINDFHGRIEASGAAAGAAVLGGMVDAYRADNPNTLFVSAGDNIGASTFTSFIQDDQPTIDALNAIGLDASAFGNHEFDQGQADVDDRILPAADWPYLGANIYDKATGEPAYDGYSLSTVGGVTVGFIGAVTTEMPSLVSPDGIANLEFGDIPTAVNRVADQLSDGDESNGEADVVVLLVHEGAGSPALEDAIGDTPMGHIVNGVDEDVDAIVSGHTHQVYNHSIPIPGTDRSRPVISEGSYGENYGHMNLSVDPATGELLSIDSEVLPLAGAFPPDPEVAQIVADAVDVADELGAVKVGEITADFNRAKQTATPSENRGGESPLGNFVADVQLWATQASGSQLALMNPGGLRADLTYASSGPDDPDGNVTYKEAAVVQPFANTLVTMDLTGAQLKQVLEEQWQPEAASRPFLKLGVSEGFEYTYDPTAADGDHIDAMYLNGELVDPDATYQVTVNSFLAAGGDNFGTLAEGANAADSGKIDLQSMVDYFEANPVASPDYAQRAVGVTLSAEDVAPGDTLTLDLSSLLFSNGEPNEGTAVVSAGDTVLGQAAIDPTIVDTTDEVGRASVTVTIPADAAGTLVLTVSVPETGTSIDVPVTVTAPPVEKAESHTFGFANKLLVKHDKPVQYTVYVVARGVEPTGEVRIYDGDTVIATAVLEEHDHGRVKVKLPGFDRGIHWLHAEYAGNDTLEPSRSFALPLLVY
jgi:5'-nucleotidase